MLKPIINRTLETLRNTEDTVCLQRARLVTEAYKRWEDAPAPIRRARALQHVLANMSLDLETNPILAGNTSSRPRAWMLLPEYKLAVGPQIALENPGIANLLQDALPDGFEEDYWRDRQTGRGNASIGHLAVDMGTVVHRGLAALVEETHRYAELGTHEEREYRQAMGIALRAVIDWAGRFAEAAERAAQSETDPVLRDCHARVAAACRQVPAHPARSLFEGLQAMALVHLVTAIEGHGLSISIGSPDRVLAPFIDEAYDPEEAADLVAALMLKLHANSFQGRGSKTQTFTVGGAYASSEDAANPITMAFLEACDRLRLGDPTVFLRWHPGLERRVKAKAFDMLSRGVSMPLLINDPPTVQGFIEAGFLPEAAWEYCVIGCNELGIPGLSAESAWSTSGSLLYPKLLNEALLEDGDLGSMDQVLARMEARLYASAWRAHHGWEAARKAAAAQVPTPFTSALMRGCIQRGQDLLVGMAYHNPGYYERGFTNAVNALAVLDTVVFQGDSGELSDPQIRLDALRMALVDDFEDEILRLRLRSAPKWGNDDERADRWAQALLEMRERVLKRLDAELMRPPHMVCHVVRSLHHLDGAQIEATPDGRVSRAPLADSLGAEVGTAEAGPTAVLNSVSKLDAARFYKGGYNLNLTLPPTTPVHVEALVEGFFAVNGQELQVNSLDAAALLDAQANPEKYADLLVRVAGLSARFIDLAPLEQEELIRRAEALG